MEELLIRHRKQQKDLQGRITQKKRNATKKTRKGVNDECEGLERDLKEKQQAEIDALTPTSNEDETEKLEINGDGHHSVSVADQEEPIKAVCSNEEAREKSESTIQSDGHRGKKPNRQKARLARRAAEQQAQVDAAAEEAASLPDLRDQELKAMQEQLKTLGLTETFIQPDGHCLYSACAHGLGPEEVKKSGPYSPLYQNVRYAAADFIFQHPDDFAPFLEEPLDVFVHKIRDTAEWGGQLELQAIAKTYNVDINVLQADGRVEKIESGDDKKSKGADIWLAYYRHSFGLGEHYNALSKADDT